MEALLDAPVNQYSRNRTDIGDRHLLVEVGPVLPPWVMPCGRVHGFVTQLLSGRAVTNRSLLIVQKERIFSAVNSLIPNQEHCPSPGAALEIMGFVLSRLNITYELMFFNTTVSLTLLEKEQGATGLQHAARQ